MQVVWLAWLMRTHAVVTSERATGLTCCAPRSAVASNNRQRPVKAASMWRVDVRVRSRGLSEMGCCGSLGGEWRVSERREAAAE